jgi:hypothetical protein
MSFFKKSKEKPNDKKSPKSDESPKPLLETYKQRERKHGFLADNNKITNIETETPPKQSSRKKGLTEKEVALLMPGDILVVMYDRVEKGLFQF